jgi:hypothetical protein
MVATGSRASVTSVAEAIGKGESTARVVTSGFFLDGINFGSVNAYRYLIKLTVTLPRPPRNLSTAPSALKLLPLPVLHCAHCENIAAIAFVVAVAVAFPLISRSLSSHLIKTPATNNLPAPSPEFPAKFLSSPLRPPKSPKPLKNIRNIHCKIMAHNYYPTCYS